jgi:hypothetical protein
MEPKHPHQLLEMIVEHRVVHERIDVIERLGSDRVARVSTQRNTCGGEKSRRVHAYRTKVTYNEATEFVWRRERETRDGILWVCFKSNAILEHRREECGKEKARETIAGRVQPHRYKNFDLEWTLAGWSTHSSSHLIRFSSVSNPNALTTLGVIPSVPA